MLALLVSVHQTLRLKLTVDVRLKLFVLRLHEVLKVLIPHLLDPSGCRYRKLSNESQLYLFV